jgi:hypothetical protein
MIRVGIWRQRRGVIITTIVLLSAAMVGSLAYMGIPARAAAPAPVAAQNSEPTPSPLIFGMNMSLFDTNDQIVNNPATQQLLRRERVPIIRMPFRSTLSDAYELQTLQAIKTIGAIPLVIIQGAADVNALADDTHLIGLVQRVFGKSTVYVEYGNEEDLAGIDVTRYTNSWNAVVPHLKAMAPTYQFGGPVNYQYNPTYVATFDQHANPRPDFNSWHEYVCGTSDSDAYCLAHIANWTTHIQATNSAVAAAIGTTIPIMITEWNLDPQQDPRYTNASFIQPWTLTALQTLEANTANGLVAAMQYCATNNQGFELIDSGNNLTPQGQTFFQQLQRIAGGTPPPPPTTTPPPATTPPPLNPGNVTYSFEDGGTDGWQAYGDQITAVCNSTAQAIAGHHSLQVQLSDLRADAYPYVGVSTQVTPAAGQLLSMYIYVPPHSGTVEVRPFTMDESYQWIGDDEYIQLKSGWNHVLHALPPHVSGQVIQLGVQFMAHPGTTVDGSVYLDAVGWLASVQ